MKKPTINTNENVNRIVKTFIKNYDYGTFIGILTCTNDSEYRKTYLQYYQVFSNGSTRQLTEYSKETHDLEKLARNFINKQEIFILWSY
jgi:hypothetical protein